MDNIGTVSMNFFFTVERRTHTTEIPEPLYSEEANKVRNHGSQRSRVIIPLPILCRAGLITPEKYVDDPTVLLIMSGIPSLDFFNFTEMSFQALC
jgi:hypothetical protein